MGKTQLEREKKYAFNRTLANPFLSFLDSADEGKKGNIFPFIEKRSSLLKRAVAEVPRFLICSDDRDGRGIKPCYKLPASGIGMSKAQKIGFARAYRQKIKHVGFHSCCAAAKHQCSMNGNGADPIQVAEAHSRGLAKMLRAKAHFNEVQGIHQARLLILDGTTVLNEQVVPFLNPSFKISVLEGLEKDYFGYWSKLLLEVAFDHEHSIGKYFGPKHPFYVFVLAKDCQQLLFLTGIAREAAAQYCNYVNIRALCLNSMGIKLSSK